jgi:DNA-binding response OmpR family regulator
MNSMCVTMAAEKEQIAVFIAEDNSEHRNFLKESFKKAGIKVKVYSFNCEEKLMNSLGQATASPDIIFLTFNLEPETAVTCLKRIRIKKKLSNVPVIVFSPFTYLKDIEEAFNNGASLFIPKPIFMKESTKTLQTIFYSKWRHDLLNPNRYKFVLTTNSEDSGKLSWSSS